MQNTKLTYIATVLAGGALILSAASALFSALPYNNAPLLEQRIAELEVENQRNSARIAELDLGLAAVVKVAGIDYEQLRGAIILLRTTTESAPVQKEPQPEPVQKQAEPAAEVTADEELVPLTISAPVKAVEPEAPVEHPALTIGEVDAILGALISEKWYKPDGADSALSAVVRLSFDQDGNLVESTMTRASGDKRFDESVNSAVKSISKIKEVAQLSDDDYTKSYKARTIQFTPSMGR